MKRFHWLVVGLALGGLTVGCGDDDGPADTGEDTAVADTGGDTGPLPSCNAWRISGGFAAHGVEINGDTTPSTDPGSGMAGATCESAPATMAAVCPSGDMVPDEAGLMGACCYRATNSDRTAAPEFRLSALRILEPPSLAAALVRGALQQALDEERFNWLIRLQGADADGEVSVTTGFGTRNADATFDFTSGTAPGPGDPNRWDPRVATGTLTGESLFTPPFAGTFTVPILEDDGVAVVLELPLQAFELQCSEMTDSRNCIGERDGNIYQSSHGSLQTYITVADAMNGRVALPPIDTSLCNFIAGMAMNADPCTDTPAAMWPIPPNAICTGGSCNDSCAP